MFGFTPPINPRVSRAEQAEAKKRAARQAEYKRKWVMAERARERWTPEQFEEEELRLKREIESMIAARALANCGENAPPADQT